MICAVRVDDWRLRRWRGVEWSGVGAPKQSILFDVDALFNTNPTLRRTMFDRVNPISYPAMHRKPPVLIITRTPNLHSDLSHAVLDTVVGSSLVDGRGHAHSIARPVATSPPHIYPNTRNSNSGRKSSPRNPVLPPSKLVKLLRTPTGQSSSVSVPRRPYRGQCSPGQQKTRCLFLLEGTCCGNPRK
jgi:hypothetical protein